MTFYFSLFAAVFNIGLFCRWNNYYINLIIGCVCLICCGFELRGRVEKWIKRRIN